MACGKAGVRGVLHSGGVLTCILRDDAEAFEAIRACTFAKLEQSVNWPITMHDCPRDCARVPVTTIPNPRLWRWRVDDVGWSG